MLNEWLRGERRKCAWSGGSSEQFDLSGYRALQLDLQYDSSSD